MVQHKILNIFHFPILSIFFSLKKFADYTNELEAVKEKLKRGDLSADEYKKTLERYKVCSFSFFLFL